MQTCFFQPFEQDEQTQNMTFVFMTLCARTPESESVCVCARACHVRCRVVLAAQFPQLPSPTIPLQLPWVQLLVPVRMHGAARAQRQLKLGGPGVSWDFAVSVFGGILALSSSHPGPFWYHARGVLGPSWLMLIAMRGSEDAGRCLFKTRTQHHRMVGKYSSAILDC